MKTNPSLLRIQDYFITDEQYEAWLEWLEDHGLEPPGSRADGRRDVLAANGDYHLGPYPEAIRNQEKWAHQKGTVRDVIFRRILPLILTRLFSGRCRCDRLERRHRGRHQHRGPHGQNAREGGRHSGGERGIVL